MGLRGIHVMSWCFEELGFCSVFLASSVSSVRWMVYGLEGDHALKAGNSRSCFWESSGMRVTSHSVLGILKVGIFAVKCLRGTSCLWRRTRLNMKFMLTPGGTNGRK